VGSQQVFTDLQERDLLDVKNCSTFTIESVLDVIIQDNRIVHRLTWESLAPLEVMITAFEINNKLK